MTVGERVAAEAQALVGVRFRPQGRDPRWGLDCVGLAGRALAAGGFRGTVPANYPMRGGVAAEVAAAIDAVGLVRGRGGEGELLLCASGPGQLHLAITTTGGIVHADALLRRVVERPGAVPWPVIGRWRVAEQE